MSKISFLLLCAGTCGQATCGATQRTVDVNRSLMVPLHDPPTAALTPSQRVAVHGSVSALPTTGPLTGGVPDTGVQVPGVQLSAGALTRFDSGVLLGGDAHGAVSSVAVKADHGQLTMGQGITAGARLRFGGAWTSTSGLGLTASVEPGLDVLALSDTLNGDTVATTFALGGSLTPTYEFGRARVFAGVMAALVPQMSRTIQVTCFGNSCGDTGPKFGDYGAAIGGTTGVRYQLAPDKAVALSATLTREPTGWVPALGLTFAIDVASRVDVTEEPVGHDGPWSDEAVQRARAPYQSGQPPQPQPAPLPEPTGPPPPPYAPP